MACVAPRDLDIYLIFMFIIAFQAHFSGHIQLLAHARGIKIETDPAWVIILAH
jgi:hypothetical protein